MFARISKVSGDQVHFTLSSVFARWLAVLAGACALTACDSSGSSNSGNTPGTPAPTLYTISGTVSGASGNGLVLNDNGVTLSVPSGATTFAYPVGLASGTGYAVSVQSSPTGLACTVANGSGTTTANVSNIAVTCVPQTITVTLGGTISGLNASGLVLANNGSSLPVNSGATTFTFSSLVTAGTTYEVTVQAAPAGLTCSVADGAGIAGTADISNVVVTCSPRSFTVGGTIAGLNGIGLVLANGADRLSVPSGATSFTMPTPVASTSGYSVIVATQPNGLSCSVQNGASTIGTANVTNIAVTCTDQPFTLGGTITGLNGTGLVLANGSDTVTVPANATGFTLPTPVPFASTYSVTVATQPTGLTCSVSSGATGTMPASNVNTVAVVCSDQAYSLGGSITGLSTAGLVLANGTDTVSPPAAATSFTFPTHVAYTSGYAVSVSTQPTGLTCSVSAGTNTMPAAPVTTVVVTCSPISYTLGGSITGLLSTGLVLTDGNSSVSPAANATSFSLPTAVAFGSPYTITVSAQPADQYCVVIDGTGTMPAGNSLSTVQVACTTWTWEGGSSVGGATGNYSAAPVQPGARDSQMSWTDSNGKFWMFGGFGFDQTGVEGELDDLWMFDPGTQLWTFVSGSPNRNNAGMYGNLGVANTNNLPGGRQNAVTWMNPSTGQVWMFGGFGYDYLGNPGNLNDLWMYDPGTQIWTWESGSQAVSAVGVYTPGGQPGARSTAFSWIDSTGRLWLFGGTIGNDVNNHAICLNDLWYYDPVAHGWTFVNGSTAPQANGTYGTAGTPGGIPGSRNGEQSWKDSSGHFWLFGGTGYGATGTTLDLLNDLWEFDPGSMQWTYISGSEQTGASGVYGTMGLAATGNMPGARGGGTIWTDTAGNVWLFGGFGYDHVGGTASFLNDLWTYNPTTQQWTWVSGPDVVNTSAGNYGTLGTPATTNQPGSRIFASGWTDTTGHLWLFGGEGSDSVPTLGDLNDLWRF
jgi:N-acetylneuraminic acid mutarotase